MIFNKLTRLPLSYPNDLEGIHFVLDPNNAELNGVYVTANSGTPRLVASLDGSKWLVSGANTIAPKYGKHIDASIIDNLDTVLNISSYMKTSDYVSVNGNTAIKHVDYALNSTNDRDGNNIINTYATKSEIPSLVEYVTKTYLNTYVEVKRGLDDNYVTAAEKIYWNAKQQALGFTPEMQGVAVSLITTLKGGVGTAGDTLKKLYDLYLSGYSEFTVPNIDARNNFNITKLPTNIFVLDDGDTKWALYKAITTGTNATYVKLSDPDLLNSLMTASQIAASYESVADVNRFTNTLKAKLDSITSIFTTELKIIYDGNTNWISTSGASLITDSHVHSNKSILDLIVGTSTGYLKMNGTGLVFDNSTFSQSNHNHNLNNLSEKSYLSLTNKPTLLSQFTNDLGNYGSFVTGTPWTGYGYLTGITGTQVTTSLGYTPYNSTNPSGYISSITKAQVETVLTGLITTHTHNYLSSFTETDPIFTAWNKSTGISITKSQVSDFPTSLSQFNNNLGNYGGWITGINSGMVTTALGYTPKPTFTENSGFNKNFGSTTGTVLEGRTFGTAAGSAVGDFQPTITGLTTNYIPKWNGSTMRNSLISDDGARASIINYYSGNLDGILTILNPNSTGYNSIFLGKSIATGGISNIGFHDDVNTPSNSYTYISAYGTSPSIKVYQQGTVSTTPTNGSLVVGGGMGVGGNIFSSGDIKAVGGDVSYYAYMRGNYSQNNAFELGVSGHKLITTMNDYLNGGTLQLWTADAPKVTIVANGNVGIGYTTDQGYKLAVNGSGYFNGTINATNYIGKSNGFYTVQITQAAYTALGTKDASTIYMIVG